MGFTRSFLKALGIDEDKIEAIMSEHVTVTDSLKSERDKFKAEAEKAAELQKQLDDINGGEDYKSKFEKEHEDFENFKKKTAEDAETAKVKAAYRNLLIDEKISTKRLETVMRVTDFSTMKLDKDGKLANEEELRKAIGDEWSEFRTVVVEKGADVENPPKIDKSAFDSMSLTEKMQYANQNPTDPSVAAWLNK